MGRINVTAVITLLAAALPACGQSGSSADNTAPSGFRPPEMQRPAAIPGQANTTPLSAYVGHYPRDAVAGVDFFDRTEVARTLNTAVGDQKIRSLIVKAQGPTTPIFSLPGDRLASWGCEAHNCGNHNWTVIVADDPKAGRVCYHNERIMGNKSRWFAGGAGQLRSEACPSEARASG